MMFFVFFMFLILSDGLIQMGILGLHAEHFQEKPRIKPRTDSYRWTLCLHRWIQPLGKRLATGREPYRSFWTDLLRPGYLQAGPPLVPTMNPIVGFIVFKNPFYPTGHTVF